MAYANLPQLLALSKTSSEAGLEIEPFPTLKSQSNTHIAEFNDDVEQWLRKAVAAIEKALTEQVSESFDTGSFGSGEKGEKGDKGDKGDRGEPGTDGATGAAGSSGTGVLTIGAFTDPNGNVTGNVKDTYKSSVGLGGDGSFWIKVSGSGTTTVWED